MLWKRRFNLLYMVALNKFEPSCLGDIIISNSLPFFGNHLQSLFMLSQLNWKPVSWFIISKYFQNCGHRNISPRNLSKTSKQTLDQSLCSAFNSSISCIIMLTPTYVSSAFSRQALYPYRLVCTHQRAEDNRERKSNEQCSRDALLLRSYTVVSCHTRMTSRRRHRETLRGSLAFASVQDTCKTPKLSAKFIEVNVLHKGLQMCNL